MAKPVLLEIILNLYLKGQKPNPIYLKLNAVALSSFVSLNCLAPSAITRRNLSYLTQVIEILIFK
jgi:hypothetical protein